MISRKYPSTASTNVIVVVAGENGMLVKEIPVQSLGNHSYLLVSQETHQAAVIDPARDVDRYINEANLRKLC